MNHISVYHLGWSWPIGLEQLRKESWLGWPRANCIPPLMVSVRAVFTQPLYKGKGEYTSSYLSMSLSLMVFLYFTYIFAGSPSINPHSTYLCQFVSSQDLGRYERAGTKLERPYVHVRSSDQTIWKWRTMKNRALCRDTKYCKVSNKYLGLVGCQHMT